MKFIFSLIIFIICFSLKTHAVQVDEEYWHSKKVLENIIHFDQDPYLDSLDTVEIVRVKHLILTKTNDKFKLTFYKNFVFFQVDAKVNGIAHTYVFAVNSAYTFYRIYGFVMNDIMSLCTDIKADIDYLYGKKVNISKELKTISLRMSNGEYLDLYKIYRGTRNCSFDYKKYPLLMPNRERNKGYVITRCIFDDHKND